MVEKLIARASPPRRIVDDPGSASFPDPAVSRQHWQNLTALYGNARRELLLCLFGSNDAITPIHSTPCQCDL